MSVMANSATASGSKANVFVHNCYVVSCLHTHAPFCILIWNMFFILGDLETESCKKDLGYKIICSPLAVKEGSFSLEKLITLQNMKDTYICVSNRCMMHCPNHTVGVYNSNSGMFLYTTAHVSHSQDAAWIPLSYLCVCMSEPMSV